jgi:hypothetical protein
MIIDLRDLLRTHKIAHPSRIMAADLRGSELSLFIGGRAWWRGQDGSTTGEEVVFRFSNVSDGQLDLVDVLGPDNDEALEFFEVSSLADVEWARPGVFQIFCHGPLPDPPALYSKLQDRLRAIRSVKGARDFLNVGAIPKGAGTLSRFGIVVASESYLIARGPECIRQTICEELDRQAVSYNFLPQPHKPDERLLVRLGCSWFYCAAAFAEID